MGTIVINQKQNYSSVLEHLRYVFGERLAREKQVTVNLTTHNCKKIYFEPTGCIIGS